MEEQWLYEAITGTYLPLLQMFEGLVADDVPFRCTVSLSAPLHHDADRRSAEAALRRAPRQADRARREGDRAHQARAALPPARAHVPRPLPVAAPHLALPRGRPGARVPPPAGRRPRRGDHVDGDARLLPADGPQLGGNIRAQVHVAADLYERHFGRRPRGMWLGECGYVPGVDELLREAAIRYFFVDSHGILFADRRPVYGVYAPLYCPSGVAAFGRDMESSRAGVERQGGLPGRSALPRLLSRHRLRPAARLHRAVHPPRGAPRVHRHQVPRDHPRPAARQVGLRPGHRARQGRAARLALPRQPRRSRSQHLAAHMDRPPIVVSPYDAELYGHWWYEGPLFLGDLFRQLHFDQDVDRDRSRRATTWTATAPTRWRRRARRRGASRATTSYWLNETNAWTYRHLHVAGRAHGGAGAPPPDAPTADRRARSTRRRAS